MTTLTNSLGVHDDFAHAYLVPFLVSFVVLLVLLLLYVGYTKRLSLLQTARIVVPVMVVSLLAVLVLPRDIVPDAFLVERTAVMFFWAIIWIFCAKAIDRGWASATTVMGRVRGLESREGPRCRFPWAWSCRGCPIRRPAWCI